jgi:hypothetical protein
MAKYQDNDGDVWEEEADGSYRVYFEDGSYAEEMNKHDVERYWGPLTVVTEPTNFRVVQTVAAFGYPKGMTWGPYIGREDAEKRVELLETKGGAGLIDEGHFGPACAAVRPAYENGSEEVKD